VTAIWWIAVALWDKGGHHKYEYHPELKLLKLDRVLYSAIKAAMQMREHKGGRRNNERC
jgi:hypothetical protein